MDGLPHDGGLTLVVEDDDDNRVLLVRLLRQHGLQVESASTVAGALEKLARRPRVVLLDMHLPDGTGAEVLEQIRRDKGDSAVAIVTGSAEPEALEELRAFGPDAVFIKPFALEQLCEWVRSMHAPRDPCSSAPAPAS